VVKNKMAPPFREVEFDILYGQGVSRSGEVIDMASDEGIIQKSGAWYSMEGERIGQGRDNARTYLDEHPELLASLEMRVLEKHGIRRKVAQLGENAQTSDATAARASAREPTAKNNSEPKPAPTASAKAASDARNAPPAKKAGGK
jgi:recombination protein RecA